MDFNIIINLTEMLQYILMIFPPFPLVWICPSWLMVCSNLDWHSEHFWRKTAGNSYGKLADQCGILPQRWPLTTCVAPFRLTRIQHWRNWRLKFTVWNHTFILTDKSSVKNHGIKGLMRTRQWQHLVWKITANYILKYQSFKVITVLRVVFCKSLFYSLFRIWDLK